MNHAHLFYPCLAMMLLTVTVLCLMFLGRKNAVKTGEISSAYFKTYDTGEKLPRKARQAERCFHNLMESLPPFYFICTMTVALKMTDPVFVIMAWFYVVCRLMQSVTHITSNKIGPRSGLFTLSWIIMIAFGIRLVYLTL